MSDSEISASEKEKLGEELIRKREELLELMAEEERLSKEISVDKDTLKARAEKRNVLLEEIDSLAVRLVDLGESVRIRRKKQLKA